ncbi:MAG: CBS domain-containing protein [Polyangiaceae bacterium]
MAPPSPNQPRKPQQQGPDEREGRLAGLRTGLAALESRPLQVAAKGQPMRVGEICRRDVATIRREDPLLTGIRRFVTEHTTDLVVVDEHEVPIGVLTERDILASIVLRTAPRTNGLTVGDIRFSGVRTVETHDDVAETIRALLREQRRCAAVVTDGRLVGTLDFDDVMRVVAADPSNLSELSVSARAQLGLGVD